MSHEQELVERLRAGEGAAFNAVYRAYRPRVYSFLVRLSGKPALAEDLLQETFIRLAKHAPRLAEDTRLAAWLFTVARNLFISQRRWSMLDIGKTAELRLWSKVRGEQETPFALIAADETQRRIEQAIAALPLKYREVLLLVAVERMAPGDAAGVLQLKPAAVRQRLKRARAMLREQV